VLGETTLKKLGGDLNPTMGGGDKGLLQNVDTNKESIKSGSNVAQSLSLIGPGKKTSCGANVYEVID
jgi:hypothetical protein